MRRPIARLAAVSLIAIAAGCGSAPERSQAAAPAGLPAGPHPAQSSAAGITWSTERAARSKGLLALCVTVDQISLNPELSLPNAASNATLLLDALAARHDS